MRAYVITTGTIFGLIVLAHVWRATVETEVVKDPAWIALTALAAALCAWSFKVLRSLRG